MVRVYLFLHSPRRSGLCSCDGDFSPPPLHFKTAVINVGARLIKAVAGYFIDGTCGNFAANLSELHLVLVTEEGWLENYLAPNSSLSARTAAGFACRRSSAAKYSVPNARTSESQPGSSVRLLILSRPVHLAELLRLTATPVLLVESKSRHRQPGVLVPG
jgi:hypothetical protein